MIDLDLHIRCSVCNHTPANLRMNGQTVCRSCALAAIDGASASRTAIRSPELAGRLLDVVRASDSPLTVARLRRHLATSVVALHAAIDALLADGTIVRSPRGYAAAGTHAHA